MSASSTASRPAGGIPRYRSWTGPALLAAGFRPFFLLAGLWAVLAVPLWLAVLGGHVTLPSAFDPMTWHAHEMLFGFAQASVAGFLLTAVPNWTGRMPIQGLALGGLVLLFVTGRAAVALSAIIGPVMAAAIDIGFPLVLLAALAREIIAGRNWRNLPMLGALVLIAAANALTHLEPMELARTAGLGLRLGFAVVIALVALIGGRIIPSFTRNWLAKRGSPRLPAPFGRLDAATMAATVAALAAWVAIPDFAAVVGPLMALAGAANLVRLARWQGHRTLAEPLVWVLHLGFLWVPVGFALMATSAVVPALPSTAALHALGGGAAAIMILAVQTRATLGHTGRILRADRLTTLAYGLAVVSVTARIAAGVSAHTYLPLLAIAGAAWVGAFGLFLAVYGPMLLTRRADGSSG